MKNFFTLLATFCAIAVWAQPKTPSGESLRLELQSNNGTNGCAVVWNPKAQLYYTVIAGNKEFPIDIFDRTGKWRAKKVADIDNRGLWYNPKTGKLGGRAHNGDLAEWAVTGNGVPSEFSIVGQMQVDGQYVATFGKGYLYLNKGDIIEKYSLKGKKSAVTKVPENLSLEDFNSYSMGYTDMKGYEFVLYNKAETKLVFLNLKGKQTATVQLPDYVPYAESFRFSFANGYAWLYDADTRAWSGFKIF